MCSSSPGQDSDRKLRTQCLRLINDHTDQLLLKQKTKELIFFLFDSLLISMNYKLENPELMCVTCIFFVLKFENEVNDEITDFMHFVLNELKFSITQIRKTEGLILINLPNFFFSVSSFGEIISSLLRIYNRDPHLIKNEFEFICRNFNEAYIQSYLNPHSIDLYVNMFIDSFGLLPLSLLIPNQAVELKHFKYRNENSENLNTFKNRTCRFPSPRIL